MSEVWREPRPNKARRIFQEFPDIPTKKFEKKDFRMLVKVLSEVFAEWEGIGMSLEIVQNVMTNLGDKWKKQSTRGLIGVLNEWMKGHNEEKRLYPCWKSVVYVVADELGGQNPAAARNIAKYWKVFENDPFYGCDVAKTADKAPLHTLTGLERTRFIQRLYTDFLHEVGQMWFEIGVLLGIPFPKLETMDTKHNKLMEVIAAWLDLYYDLDYLPVPTVGVLVDAVAHVMGGNNRALAIRIAGNVRAPRSNGESSHDVSTPEATPQQQQQTHQQHQQTRVDAGENEQQLPMEATGVSSEAYSTSMTVDQLYLWLLASHLPPEDCKAIKDKNINGMAFQYIPEGDWQNYGISPGGLIILKNHIIKQISPSGQTNGSCRSSSSHGTQSQENDTPVSNSSAYVSSLPASAHRHLKAVLDWDNDLIEIAHHMLEWEEKLRKPLGLNNVDVHDIKAKERDHPELQRREALRCWKNKQGLNATYGNLLELFEKAGHSECAEAVCVVLRKK